MYCPQDNTSNDLDKYLHVFQRWKVCEHAFIDEGDFIVAQVTETNKKVFHYTFIVMFYLWITLLVPLPLPAKDRLKREVQMPKATAINLCVQIKPHLNEWKEKNNLYQFSSFFFLIK